jgi:hypothetical protein
LVGGNLSHGWHDTAAAGVAISGAAAVYRFCGRSDWQIGVLLVP